MILFLLAIIALLQLAAGEATPPRGCTSPSKLTDVMDLPSLSPGGVATIVDVYYCPKPQAQSLIVVLPGALGDKAWYSKLATALASHGDGIVVVAQQTRCLPPGCANGSPGCFCGNLVSRFAVDEAIKWASSPIGRGQTSGLRINAARVYIVSHSLGAAEAMFLLAGQCGQFCAQADAAAPTPRGVRGAFGWGYTLWQRGLSASLGKDTYLESVRNTNGPWMWMNGGGDTELAKIERETRTLELLSRPKAFAELEGLDHFSIADKTWPAQPRPTDVTSTLDRDAQVGAVAAAVQAWLATVDELPCPKGEGVCERLGRIDFGPSALRTCVQELC